MAIRVLLADDHKIIRDGLRALFARSPELALVGEATDGQEAIDMAAELQPEVVVMDITMPRVDGPDATRRILGAHPAMKVVALSMHTDMYFVDQMKAAGASGYVPKEDAYDVLLAAIQTVHGGGTFFPGR